MIMNKYYTVKEGQICRGIISRYPVLKNWVNVKSACKIKDRFYHTMYDYIDKLISAQKKPIGTIAVDKIKIPYRIIRGRWRFVKITKQSRWRLLTGRFSITDEARTNRAVHKCLWCGAPRACYQGKNGFIYCNEECERFSVKFMAKSAYA